MKSSGLYTEVQGPIYWSPIVNALAVEAFLNASFLAPVDCIQFGFREQRLVMQRVLQYRLITTALITVEINILPHIYFGTPFKCCTFYYVRSPILVRVQQKHQSHNQFWLLEEIELQREKFCLWKLLHSKLRRSFCSDVIMQACFMIYSSIEWRNWILCILAYQVSTSGWPR